MKNFIIRYLDPGAPAGGGGSVSTGAGSASTTMPLPPAAGAGSPPAAPSGTPAGTGAAPTAGTPSTFAIPDAYKDKPYLKGVDSADKVFAMLDGAQKFVGKVALPAPDAPVEEWEKYYDAAGRPKTAAEYEFKVPAGAKVDEKITGAIKGIFHKAGLTKAQGLLVQTEFDAQMAAIMKERGIEVQKQNTDFTDLATKTFGAERDTVLASARALIDKFAPANMKDHIANLSNENLIILAGVLSGVSKTYIKEAGAPAAAPAATGMNAQQMQEEGRRLMATKEYNNWQDPGHKAMVEKVKQHYAQMNAIQKR